MNSSTEPKPAASEFRVNLELLMQVPLFAGIPIEPLKLLAYLCVRESYKPGEFLFRQQDIDSQVFYLLEGKAVVMMENGGETVLAEFGEGQLIGGQSLFADTKRLFSLRAETKVVCLILARDRFQKVLEQFPDIAPKMFEAIVRSIHQWESVFISQHATVCSGCLQNLGVTLV
ncbi:MAG TPA: cyclic nucleotide-binding domain-containing protein [Syntrophobacteraceae bacterium]|nr:cyclic nucleotide-binding domain-containing protein [Syntrophobacteraceae bacterium]HBZ56446.1 cyclic nucleotide-binding domain-containing protein [Syntrophobacteraceae bacterium]